MMKPDSTETAAYEPRTALPLVGGIAAAVETPEAAYSMEDEFPEGAAEFTDEPSRRRFLTLMGASLALAGAAGCNLRPASQRKIIPYTVQPDEITPGVPLYFASAAVVAGYGQGVLVRSNEGRPTKIEGNPDHPSSLGGAGLHALASVLDLYDPDRARNVSHRGLPSSYELAVAALRAQLYTQATPKANVRLRILTETVTSPTLASQLQELLGLFPEARWARFDAVSSENSRAGIQSAFGGQHAVVYDFNKADVVVSLDADFLCSGPGHVRYSRDFADRRKIRKDGKNAEEIAAGRQPGQPFKQGVQADQVNRLYVCECMPTNTGAVADHRIGLTTQQIADVARALAAAVGVQGAPAAPTLPKHIQDWVAPMAADLSAHKGKTVVLAAEHLPAWVHTLVAAINVQLGNVGQTVKLTAPLEAQVEGRMIDLKTLVNEMSANTVDVLIILGGANPAYSAPIDINFAQALQSMTDQGKLTCYLGTHADETAVLCEWHLPEAHYLETWGDVRGHDGTISIQQPLIAPLHGGVSAIQLVNTLLRPAESGVPGAPSDPMDIVRRRLRNWFDAAKRQGQFELFWQESVRSGVVAGTAEAPAAVNLAGNWAGSVPASAATPAGDYELNFRADPTLYDGRYANNGWLQEVPKPLTKISWDNAAYMSRTTAEKLGVRIGFRWTGGEHGRAEVDLVEIQVGDKKVTAPVWIMPGHADGAITVHLGHGRLRAGRHVGNIEGTANINTEGQQARGFNVYPLRSSANLWAVPAKVAKASGSYFLACVQGHWAMSEKDPFSGRHLNRKPVRAADLAEYRRNPRFAKIPPAAVAETELINENIPLPKTKGPHHDEDHSGHDPRMMPLNMYAPMEVLSPDQREIQRRRWAMAIDLSACTGCSACVVACQSENNSPVVGKEQVTKGRIMYWINIDRYYEGLQHEPDANHTYFQPRLCVQCENAPCEVVCPVGATVHSTDGLNDMTYNRCVGTRYCSNNCPYKVRRFNFLSFNDVYTWDTDTLKLGRNPDVSVRSRGVMEKCTFCVQRIRYAEIVAERELAEGIRKVPDLEKGETIIKDGEIVTACQAACPSGAIMFGDLNDANAVVSKWKNEPTNYGLLAELNTRPRLTYLGIVRNPNQAMPK